MLKALWTAPHITSLGTWQGHIAFLEGKQCAEGEGGGVYGAWMMAVVAGMTKGWG